MKLHLVHRSRRFFWSLRPARVDLVDAAWVESILSQRELAAFNRMGVRDRAHSIGVARAVEANLASLGESGDDRWILPAALLHDVGKSDASLGTFGRVVATLAGWIAGDDMAAVWAQKKGMTRRIGIYLMHPEIGRDILLLAESDPRVATWAAEHYLEPDEWTIPRDVGDLLTSADDGTLKKPEDHR